MAHRIRAGGLDKQPDEFPRNRSRKRGLHTSCKPCHRTRSRVSLQRLYGRKQSPLSPEGEVLRGLDEFEALVERPGGICPICLKRPAVHIDHDHKHDHSSGLVRGIVCFNCNGALGKFGDDAGVPSRAIDYLEGSGST